MMTVLKAIPHECLNEKTFDYDVQLLKLNQKVKPEKTVSLLKVPRKRQFVIPGSVCETAGWGVTTNHNNKISDKLMEVNVTILKKTTCAKIWKSKKEYKMNITKNMICTMEKTEKGTCSGDSGGPLICRGEITGITSFGDPECGSSTDASVYSYLNRNIIKWIMTKLSEAP
ncbi:granzyme A-like [Hyperolius riggenbachi]|uniref:granzyme A-like n=1 Tax=Hyperolius riggenbachi TaxID=752182 RepID=UPI0035A3A17E